MSDMLASAEWSQIATAAQIITWVIVAAVGYLVRRVVGDIDRRQAAAESAQAAIEQRLQIVEREAMRRADCCVDDVVRKEDWLRESGIIRKQQERVLGEIQQLRGRTDAGVEIASAIAAALNRARGAGGAQC